MPQPDDLEALVDFLKCYNQLFTNGCRTMLFFPIMSLR